MLMKSWCLYGATQVIKIVNQRSYRSQRCEDKDTNTCCRKSCQSANGSTFHLNLHFIFTLQNNLSARLSYVNVFPWRRNSNNGSDTDPVLHSVWVFSGRSSYLSNLVHLHRASTYNSQKCAMFLKWGKFSSLKFKTELLSMVTT